MNALPVIVADNVISHADAMRDFLDVVQIDSKYQTAIIRASEERDDGMIAIYERK